MALVANLNFLRSLMFRLLLLILVISSPAFSQQVIEGRVVDKQTGEPVPFASIGIMGTSKGTSSNLNGQFSISVTEPFTIKVSCVGYESQLINSIEGLKHIELKPTIIQLREIIVTKRKPVDPTRIVRKALASIKHNYDNTPHLQKFFYRHYCKDDSEYGRLIEAFVDVWKPYGYKTAQTTAGEREEIRVTQLRRSLDQTIAAQGHEPIGIGNILHADIVGYQLRAKKDQVDFYNTVSNLKADFNYYTFSYEAITVHDGQEVYLIEYASKEDSVLTTSGYLRRPHATGTLYITTDTHAIVKAEQKKTFGDHTIETAAFYRKYDDKYYPYHFIQEGKSRFTDGGSHLYHVELVSTEILHDPQQSFVGKLPGKEELLKIPYDSMFWKNATILKTTPLEDEIIRDLGGGSSLNAQFVRYQKYEWSISDGGTDSEEKFNWFRDFNRGKQLLYLVFWSSNCNLTCIQQLEEVKRIQRAMRKNITVVMLSLDEDPATWNQFVNRYNLFADGIINYRIGSKSTIAKEFKIKKTPSFILLDKNSEVIPADQGVTESFSESELKALIDAMQ